MNSREKILGAIAKNKPSFTAAPDLPASSEVDQAERISKFISTLESIGGKAIRASSLSSVKAELDQSMAGGEYVVNTIDLLGKVNDEVNVSSKASFLGAVYKAYIPGTLGVAENGSIWVEESRIRNRLLPFICQHLVIVLDAGKIVPDMHEALRQIDMQKEGYGVFLAGPSKTADIEQALVIGAHGARSLTVYVLEYKG